MGVLYFNTAGRPHNLSDLKDFSAAATAYFLGNGTGEQNLSLKETASRGFLPSASTNVAIDATLRRGTTGVPGVAIRFLLIDSANCQVNIAYPGGMTSVLYKPSTDTLGSTSRTYITSNESSSGYHLYCRSALYYDYSYVQISANNFSYGYSTGTWVWFNSSGSFVATAGTGSTITLYSNSYTDSQFYRLRHVAS